MQQGLDDDTTVISTAAAGIKFLCLHYRWEEGKKSQELGAMLEGWLQGHKTDASSNTDLELGSFPELSNGDYSTNGNRLSSRILATGFCAVAISQAHWANLTHDISERAAFQTKALSNFRVAYNLEVGDQANTENLYAFALALSRNRNVDAAIGVIKTALSSEAIESMSEDFTEIGVDGRQLLYAYKRRQALKSWHLLALILSAKQNFSTAIASCEAALELFGLGSTTSNRLRNGFAAENIEFSDRERIIETSMTQLALAEVVDGPEEALNHFRDLLILFGRFFGYSEKVTAKEDVIVKASPPASRNGTIKSFRSSFLGRSKERYRKPSGTKVTAGSPVFSSFESLSAVIQKTPTISVTAEDSPTYQSTPHSSHHFLHHGSKKLRKRNSKKSINSAHRGRAASITDTTTSKDVRLNSDTPIQKDPKSGQPPEPWSDDDDPGTDSQSFKADEVGIAISHDIPPLPRPPATAPIPSGTTQIPQRAPSRKERSRLSSLPASQQPPSSKISFPETLPPPEPFFPSASQTRRSLSLLTKIWLQVAALYRRAKMPTDASGAISEALRLVSTIESLVALQHSSAEVFATPDWSGVPSVSELWADALSERARLHGFLEERDEAEADYETALTHFPDHPGAIVGLSNILLDFYSQTTPDPSSPTFPPTSPKPTPLLAPLTSSPSVKPNSNSGYPITSTAKDNDDNNDDDDTLLLPRLSARDRAAGLLSSLTRSSQGWDCAEAWFALARAYELRGQVDKAKEALWWVVELEETRPVRGWGCLQW